MPRGDGTGPMGMGPMTGRRAGFCAGFAAPLSMNIGMGFARGRGFRRMSCLTGMSGWLPFGYSAYSASSKPLGNEKEYLANQAELLENQLQQLKKRLEVINGDVE